MSLILQIDTATEKAQVSIAKDAFILQSLCNDSQKDHGSFLQPAIAQLVKDTGVTLQEIDAIAVTWGPGSYTGLRVGMSSAKGLCFALNKPLIAINTLEVLAASALLNEAGKQVKAQTLLCPMIDARRMEVFTAIYDSRLQTILPPCAMVIEATSFAHYFTTNTLLFIGSGAKKMESACNNPAAGFSLVGIDPAAMAKIAEKNYTEKSFVSVAYSEPFYIKEFHY